MTSGSEQDLITGPRFAYEVHHAIPNSKLHLFERTSHNHWVERFDEWWTVTRYFFRLKFFPQKPSFSSQTAANEVPRSVYGLI